ncbi:hypothetical protein CEB3_c19020 [Peptococcaceae bacterium CEB3]|nr:hypothetical protein CEB3_c19020 [Peptococcaceae bacterium CEB3]
MFTAMILVVETNESHPVYGKFETRAEAIEAAKNLASVLMETYGGKYTFDFIVSPLA